MASDKTNETRYGLQETWRTRPRVPHRHLCRRPVQRFKHGLRVVRGVDAARVGARAPHQ